MATTLKNYLVCGDDSIVWHYFDLSPYYSAWWAELTSVLPTGIIESNDSFTNSTIGFGVQNTLAVGTHTVTIQARQETSSGTIIGSFDLVFIKESACDTEIEVCCPDDAVNIRWLGREGGIKEWVFGGVREFDIKVGEANTFKNALLQVNYSERKNIYTGKRISTGDITQDSADYLDELKYAVQAWEWDGTTATPILIDNDSFFKYTSKQKYFDVSLQYILSQEIIMQSQ